MKQFRHSLQKGHCSNRTTVNRLIKCIGSAMTLAVSACANLAPDMLTDDTVAIERVDSRSARITLVRARAIDHELKVSGYIVKQYHGRRPIPGHLHIEIKGKKV